SGEEGFTTGPGPVASSESRSKTRGTGPTEAARLVRTLDPPEPAASDTVAAGAPGARLKAWLSSPCWSQQRGQSVLGACAVGSEPQFGQRSPSAISGPPRRNWGVAP